MTISHQVLAMSSICSPAALVGAAQVVNNDTLVPLGLLVAAVTGTALITWRVARYVMKLQQDLADARRHLDQLERMYGRRTTDVVRDSTGLK